MNMTMDRPATQTTRKFKAAPRRRFQTLDGPAGGVSKNGAEPNRGDHIKLRDRLSSSPETYTRINRQPFGE